MCNDGTFVDEIEYVPIKNASVIDIDIISSTTVSGGSMRTAYVLQTVLVLALCETGVAQIRIEETRRSVDPAKGDTVLTESVIISRSEDVTPRTSVLLVNPLKFFLLYNLSYMHRVSPSLVIGGGMQLPTVAGVHGLGVNAEVRIHPSGKAPRGFYIAPNVGYTSLEAGNATANPFSIGILLGWQWFPGDDFAIGLGIGADYYSGSTSVNDGDIGKFDGMVPALRFDIGYAW
jgi:hypothetical protein